MNYNNSERDRCRRATVAMRFKAYADWCRTMPWRWWVTLTHSNEYSRLVSCMKLAGFFEEWEWTNKDSLVCLFGQEGTTLSGCGKPGSRIHYHLHVSGSRAF